MEGSIDTPTLEDLREIIEKYDSDYENNELENQLIQALEDGNVSTVESLLKRGGRFVKPVWIRKNFHLSLFDRSKLSTRKSMLELILKYGFDTGFKDHNGQNLLHQFVYYHTYDKNYGDDLEICEILLNTGLRVNDTDEQGNTLLHLALMRRNPRLVEFFIEKGADVNHKGNKRILPLTLAAQYGTEEIIDLLLVNGADVNVQNCEGFTPLHNACFRYSEPIIKFLLQRGADVCKKTNNGFTPYTILNPEQTERDNYEKCVNTMMREFAKLTMEGRAVDDYDMALIFSDPRDKEFFERCMAELQLLRDLNFYHSYSFYRLLKMSKNIKELFELVKNDDFVANFDDKIGKVYTHHNEVVCKFNNYKEELLGMMNEAVRIKNQWQTLYSNLKSVFDNFFPENVLEDLVKDLM